MKILSMGDRIRPGTYAVKARFARSVLLLDAKDRALFVVDKSIGAGPLNLVVADPNAFVGGETLAIGCGSEAPPRPCAVGLSAEALAQAGGEVGSPTTQGGGARPTQNRTHICAPRIPPLSSGGGALATARG